MCCVCTDLTTLDISYEWDGTIFFLWLPHFHCPWGSTVHCVSCQNSFHSFSLNCGPGWPWTFDLFPFKCLDHGPMLPYWLTFHFYRNNVLNVYMTFCLFVNLLMDIWIYLLDFENSATENLCRCLRCFQFWRRPRDRIAGSHGSCFFKTGLERLLFFYFILYTLVF